MAPIIYGIDVSPAVRSTLITLEALGTQYEMKEINLAAGEHLSEEYLAVIKISVVMVPVIYGSDYSPAVRAVLMTVNSMNLDVEIVEINMAQGEHLLPNFLKINPQHTVPTLKDGDYIVWDSHVINAYLVGKYGQDDSLYPKDLEKKCMVDQRMHFDNRVLYPRLSAIVGPIFRGLSRTVPKDKADHMVEAYNLLESLLRGKTYAIGEQVTIADFSFITTLTSANIVVPIASNRFPNIWEYMNNVQALPCYSANLQGLNKFASFIKSKLA